MNLATSRPATLAFARNVFAKIPGIFGDEEIDQLCGLPVGTIPPIPFTEAELEKARDLGHSLILQVDKTRDGVPLTMRSLKEMLGNELCGSTLLHYTDHCETEAFYTSDSPRPGWALVGRHLIHMSVGANYFNQTEAISNYLVWEVFGGEELPPQYQAAVDEWKERKSELWQLQDIDPVKCAEQLVGLKLNTLFRMKPVEVLFQIAAHYAIYRQELLTSKSSWTNAASGGHIVHVGGYNPGGITIDYLEPYDSEPYVGACFFRGGLMQ